MGGSIPFETGNEIVLSLKRLNQVREVDPLSDTMTVDAGVTLKTVQEAAESVDRLFPLSLASEGSCTIGGNLATNAGGTAVLAYGNARDLVLGLEVVLADGRVW
ncbi:MAG: FAD-binding oxidoreductase, partial [Dolichospermum sp.]